MPDIRIHRDHQLGLKKARKIAWQWAEEAEAKFEMECTVIEGDEADTVTFTRAGVNGRLVVAADHFAIDAKLGFLLGAFSKTIEAEIEKNLDALLAHGSPPKAAGKTGIKRAGARSVASEPASGKVASASAKPVKSAPPGALSTGLARKKPGG